MRASQLCSSRANLNRSRKLQCVVKLCSPAIFIAEDYGAPTSTWQSECAETRCVEWKSHVTIRERAGTAVATCTSPTQCIMTGRVVYRDDTCQVRVLCS